MPIRGFAYASQAVTSLPQSKVDSITADARYFNQLAGVTGIMLYDGQRFFQYIEGPEMGLHAVWDRINVASSHTNIEALGSGSMAARLFPYWSMRQVAIDSGVLGRLLMAEWSALVRKGPAAARPTGIDQLDVIVMPLVA